MADILTDREVLTELQDLRDSLNAIRNDLVRRSKSPRPKKTVEAIDSADRKVAALNVIITRLIA